MIELDLYFRLNNKFIFGPDLSVKNSWWTSAKCSINFSFRKWGSTFEACWKLNDIRHCTTINVSRRDSSSPGSPSIWLHYSFKPKKVSRRDSLVPEVPFHKNDLTSLTLFIVKLVNIRVNNERARWASLWCPGMSCPRDTSPYPL